MTIEILGTGCPKCRKLTALVEQAVAELGVEAQVAKVTALKDIMARGVMLTPALVVDGEVKASGKVPSVEQIKDLLQESSS